MEEEINKTEPNPKFQKDICFFGVTNFRNRRVKFGIKQDDRRRHMYLIGKTGMGKSTVMENMIIQDIWNGEGVALVDPHGDFAEKILDWIPNHRINDVVYFNPSDIEFPIAFNVMEAASLEHKHLIASGLIGVFKKLWADSWGPRLEYLLRNAILALLDYPGSTLLGVMRILVNKEYRERVIEKCQDPVVRSFWLEEYSKYTQQFAVEAIAPIQNKVGQFLSTAMIRNVVGQVKSTINIREIMDEQKILIMNLSKGRVGEDASALLGAMMITKIQLAAMSRIDIVESERKDFYLYVDEFQNFATESFANILSEARKYHLDLVIAHQYVEQLDEIVRAAVFGNVGTIMCFRVGAADAEFLETEFAPYFLPEDLVNLTKFDNYMKLMIDGVASNPFSSSTLPPLDKEVWTGNKDKIIKVSRERYAKPREIVEDKINRWSGVGGFKEDEEEAGPAPAKKREEKPALKIEPTFSKPRPPLRSESFAEKPRTPARNEIKRPDARKTDAPKKNKSTYTVNCYECGKSTEITFKPDGVRPVYCQACFQKTREKLMRGEVPMDKLVEVDTQAAPEISLSEALKKTPQGFDNKPVRFPPPGNAPKPPRPIAIEEEAEEEETDYEPEADTLIREQEDPAIEEIIQGSMSLGAQQIDLKNQPKTIKPGEVIKF